MATSLLFMSTDQTSIESPNELLRNTYRVKGSGQIRTEPQQKSRGRKPGSKTSKQKQKKQTLRGMGVARLERLRIEEEKKNMVVSPNATCSHDPGVVLQGFPSYGSGPNTFVGGYTRSRLVGSGQIPVYPPSSFVTHEPSSVPNNASNNHCDTCFKKQRIDGDQNVVRSNGGGFSKYTPDQKSQGFFYDHRVARYSALPSASTNQVFNEGSVEELGSGNPRDGTGNVKQYEFFPGSYGNKSVSSLATSVGDCSPNKSTIDLSLKL